MIDPKLSRSQVDHAVTNSATLRVMLSYASPRQQSKALTHIRDSGLDAVDLGIAIAVNVSPQELAQLEYTTGAVDVWVDSVCSVSLDSALAAISADHAYRIDSTLDGEGIVVAVLDTGVDATHPDLEGRILATKRFTTSSISDVKGHGTHVASIIAGSGIASNKLYRGVAPKASILIGKVLGDDGYGYNSDTIAGILWAVDNGARVINVSLGNPNNYTYSSPMSYALREAAAKGVVVVVSAGNSGPAIGSIGSPGNDPTVICVGNMRDDHTLHYTSSRGPTNDGRSKPDFVCPGVDITAARSTACSMTATVGYPQYTTLTGTSMAAPIMSGVCALILQKNPNYTPDDVKNALVDHATLLTEGAITANDQGLGVIDAFRIHHTVAPATERNVVHLSPGLKAAVLGDYGLSSMMNYGVIDIYSGNRPQAAHYAPTGTRLARISKGGLAFTRGDYTAGLTLDRSFVGVLKDTGDWILTPVANGVAGWWRWTWYLDDPGTSNPYYPRVDGLVSENLFLSNTTIDVTHPPTLIDSFFLAFAE